MEKKYIKSGFYFLPGIDMSYSDANEVYEHIVEDGIDLEEVGITDEKVLDAYYSGDGKPLYAWIEAHEQPLYALEEK